MRRWLVDTGTVGFLIVKQSDGTDWTELWRVDMAANAFLRQTELKTVSVDAGAGEGPTLMLDRARRWPNARAMRAALIGMPDENQVSVITIPEPAEPGRRLAPRVLALSGGAVLALALGGPWLARNTVPAAELSASPTVERAPYTTTASAGPSAAPVEAAHAVTGAICVSTCAMMQGSVADGIAMRPPGDDRLVVVEHPSGIFEVALATRGEGAAMDVIGGGVIRTARKIMDGQVFVPAKAFAG